MTLNGIEWHLMATQSATAKWQVGLFAIPCHSVSDSERLPFNAILTLSSSESASPTPKELHYPAISKKLQNATISRRTRRGVRSILGVCEQLRVRKSNAERVALSNFFLYLCEWILGAGWNSLPAVIVRDSSKVLSDNILHPRGLNRWNSDTDG